MRRNSQERHYSIASEFPGVEIACLENVQLALDSWTKLAPVWELNNRSIAVQPINILIPAISAIPTCHRAHYGKMVSFTKPEVRSIS